MAYLMVEVINDDTLDVVYTAGPYYFDDEAERKEMELELQYHPEKFFTTIQIEGPLTKQERLKI